MLICGPCVYDKHDQITDVVALTVDLPQHNLRRGQVGTVVEILARRIIGVNQTRDQSSEGAQCDSPGCNPGNANTSIIVLALKGRNKKSMLPRWGFEDGGGAHCSRALPFAITFVPVGDLRAPSNW